MRLQSILFLPWSSRSSTAMLAKQFHTISSRYSGRKHCHCSSESSQRRNVCNMILLQGCHPTKIISSLTVLCCVDLTVECWGVISRCENWKATCEHGVSGFSNCLPFLVEQAGVSMSDCVQLVEAVYPPQSFWAQRGGTYNFPGISYNTPALNKIDSQLRQILNMLSSDDHEEPSERTASMRALVSLLGLASPSLTSTPSRAFTRLELYAGEYSSSEHTLLWVNCSVCKYKMLFRANIWHTPGTSAHIHRIPVWRIRNRFLGALRS